jgi:nitrate/TMAO reductase-like tetraheme cytochrome c subunit
MIQASGVKFVFVVARLGQRELNSCFVVLQVHQASFLCLIVFVAFISSVVEFVVGIYGASGTEFIISCISSVTILAQYLHLGYANPAY